MKIDRGEYKCPHCGSAIDYTEDDAELYCDMCGKQIKIMEID